MSTITLTVASIMSNR